ncbi:MAG: preprotein translocase subunit SecE [Phycisphaerae bacterium]
MAIFEIYKRGQGKYTRVITFVAVVVITVIGAGILSGMFKAYALTAKPAIRFGVPSLLVLAVAALMFWIVNRPSSADFMIATESEMKKVSWSSRKEIIGSTKVVIITTLIMAAVLFGVDMLFTMLFRNLGLLG